MPQLLRLADAGDGCLPDTVARGGVGHHFGFRRRTRCRLLDQGEAELAIIHDRARGASHMWCSAPCFAMKAWRLMSPRHRLAAKPWLEAEDFADETLITYPVPDEMLDVMKHCLEPAKHQSQAPYRGIDRCHPAAGRQRARHRGAAFLDRGQLYRAGLRGLPPHRTVGTALRTLCRDHPRRRRSRLYKRVHCADPQHELDEPGRRVRAVSRARSDRPLSRFARSGPHPPASATPVMNEDSSECKNSAARATSQAVPIFPSGTRLSRSARSSASEIFRAPWTDPRWPWAYPSVPA